MTSFEVWRGAAIGRQFSQGFTYVGGMIAAGDALGINLVPCYLAEAEPSGTIEADAYRTLRRDLIASIAAALPVDGVALALHGAALTEDVDDVESDLLHAVRVLVGPHTPVVATLDLHANLTPGMVAYSTALFGVTQYPHTDMGDRGYEAVSRLDDMIAGALRPAMWLERLPLLMPPTDTRSGVVAEVNSLCAELERLPGMVDVTVFHGFPYADTPTLGAAVVSIANGDVQLARINAIRVAQELWNRRSELIPVSHTAAEAVDLALRTAKWPAIINEASDNPGCGAPGDGTHLLRAMLNANPQESAFGVLLDANAAAAAHDAGTGSIIRIDLGGKADDVHGGPIPVEAYVKTLTDGEVLLRDYVASQGRLRHFGKMARIVVNDLDILVASGRSQTHDSEVFLMHGIDVRRCRLVGIKSTHHFRAGFAPLAGTIVTADSPGISTLQVEAFVRRRSPAGLWPIDKHARYAPT